MKALVFDREEDLSDLIEYNLAKQGFEVITLTEEEEVMEAVSTHLPTLTVLGTCSSHEMQEEICNSIQQLDDLGQQKWLLVRLTTQDGICKGGECGPHTLCVQTPVKPRELMDLIRQQLNFSSLLLPD